MHPVYVAQKVVEIDDLIHRGIDIVLSIVGEVQERHFNCSSNAIRRRYVTLEELLGEEESIGRST